MDVSLLDWPNDYAFRVWSPNDGACYVIDTQSVLEFHIMRVGTRRLITDENGIPLQGIYYSYGDEYSYWEERFNTYADLGEDTGQPPVCLQFESHILANRKRESFIDHKNTGMLVVCRQASVRLDPDYRGSTPYPTRIPSNDKD